MKYQDGLVPDKTLQLSHKRLVGPVRQPEEGTSAVGDGEKGTDGYKRDGAGAGNDL